MTGVVSVILQRLHDAGLANVALVDSHRIHAMLSDHFLRLLIYTHQSMRGSPY